MFESRLTSSSSVVHRAADPRAHRSEAPHREVGHVPGLKEKKATVSLDPEPEPTQKKLLIDRFIETLVE